MMLETLGEIMPPMIVVFHLQQLMLIMPTLCEVKEFRKYFGLSKAAETYARNCIMMGYVMLVVLVFVMNVGNAALGAWGILCGAGALSMIFARTFIGAPQKRVLMNRVILGTGIIYLVGSLGAIAYLA